MNSLWTPFPLSLCASLSSVHHVYTSAMMGTWSVGFPMCMTYFKQFNDRVVDQDYPSPCNHALRLLQSHNCSANNQEQPD